MVRDGGAAALAHAVGGIQAAGVMTHGGPGSTMAVRLRGVAGFSLGLPRREGGRGPDAPPRRGHARPAAAPDPFADRGPLPAGQAGALVSQVGAGHPFAVRAGARTSAGSASRRPTASPCPGVATRPTSTASSATCPPASSRSRVRLDMICNEPAVDAAGYLTYGNDSVGIINWATCLMYPEGPSADETRVNADPRPARRVGVRLRAQGRGGCDGTAGGQARRASRSSSPRSRSPSWSTTR